MRKQIASIALVAALSLGCARAADRYQIDPVHSTVSFKIRHLGISYVSGGFTDFAGNGTFDAEKPEASSIAVTVKTESITTANQKRDKHLRGDDFFDVEKFPTMSFESKSVKKSGADTYEVTGDFTLLGVSKSVTVTVKDLGSADGMQGEKRHGGETQFTIKRSDWGMGKMVGPIGDDVHITLAFSAIKK
jgi:polyisoprenoid-binding protein YceI